MGWSKFNNIYHITYISKFYNKGYNKTVNLGKGINQN